MKITLKTTEHELKPQQQIEKIKEEFIEFFGHLELYKISPNRDLLLNMLHEGFDLAKTVQKYLFLEYNEEPKEINVNKSGFTTNCDISNLKGLFEDFFLSQNHMLTKAIIYQVLVILHSICQDNTIDLLEELKKNDEKNKKRGVGLKCYISSEDFNYLQSAGYMFSGIKERVERINKSIEENNVNYAN